MISITSFKGAQKFFRSESTRGCPKKGTDIFIRVKISPDIYR